MPHVQMGLAREWIVPEETDARFVSQHLAAYAFAKPFVQGKRVLEIGFGDGYGSNDLADVASEVTGIDREANKISRARQKYPRPNLRFLEMDATQLRFPDSSFEAVCSFQVIEHIPEALLQQCLSEIRRVLTPQGVLCVSTLNLEHNMKPGRPYEKLCFHEKEFTGPELRALLLHVFPSVELHGLYLTRRHRLFQRLKKWGLMKLGPAHLNPVARFYSRVPVNAFRTKPRIAPDALDLLAVCRKTMTSGSIPNPR